MEYLRLHVVHTISSNVKVITSKTDEPILSLYIILNRENEAESTMIVYCSLVFLQQLVSTKPVMCNLLANSHTGFGQELEMLAKCHEWLNW